MCVSLYNRIQYELFTVSMYMGTYSIQIYSHCKYQTFVVLHNVGIKIADTNLEGTAGVDL